MEEQITYKLNNITYTVNRIFEEESNEESMTFLDVFKRMILNELGDK